MTCELCGRLLSLRETAAVIYYAPVLCRECSTYLVDRFTRQERRERAVDPLPSPPAVSLGRS